MANCAQTVQQEYATAMLFRLAEERPSVLIEFSERAVVRGAGSYFFYRLDESGVGTNTINMFDPAYTGTAGAANSYEAVIDYVYAHDKLTMKQLNSTSLNLKSSFIESIATALDRNVDLAIITTIAGTAGIVPVGQAALAVDDPANINELLQWTSYAATLAKETSVDKRQGVALAMSLKVYSRLFKAEKLTNALYYQMNEFGKKRLFGCEVVILPKNVTEVTVGGVTTENGVMYIIPSKTYGTASWEGAVEAKAWEEPGQDAFFFMAKRSLGVVVIEPESIFEFSFDPTL